MCKTGGNILEVATFYTDFFCFQKNSGSKDKKHC